PSTRRRHATCRSFNVGFPGGVKPGEVCGPGRGSASLAFPPLTRGGATDSRSCRTGALASTPLPAPVEAGRSAHVSPRKALMSLAPIVARLRAAGCVFAEDEARLLAGSAPTPAALSLLVKRRVAGEPLEHVLGWARFCGLRIEV